MSSCEKCWSSSFRPGAMTSRADVYMDELKQHSCTPEQQAGSMATECPKCNRMCLHQHTQQCMNGCKKIVEVWKQIQNTTYEVSSFGRVKRADGRILKPGTSRGYLSVGLRLAGRKRTHTIHYLVCVTFNPRPTGAECVRHLDGDKANNARENLRWGTNLENAQDTILHGRQVCGFDHPSMFIKKIEARTIRAAFCDHMVGRIKAKNGFILSLVEVFPHLGYKCIFKAAHGAYDEIS